MSYYWIDLRGKPAGSVKNLIDDQQNLIKRTWSSKFQIPDTSEVVETSKLYFLYGTSELLKDFNEQTGSLLMDEKATWGVSDLGPWQLPLGFVNANLFTTYIALFKSNLFKAEKHDFVKCSRCAVKVNYPVVAVGSLP
ncbi:MULTISPECIES: hypothetical protein [Rhizobium/Agrobacterium group]|uniref:hypothetical protein n=1 Tax=Rhizobium/Agrobacterium group TaxID=227290 RepID=UPI00157416A6|nr:MULTISPECIES: hypothetical protein [Rhizobium/Agrobacterium group]NSZ66848.1 hypothetical protein [Agrobacterium tumefaciens]NTA19717.1 hypothetical protein [Agrobacterium tumefaciens]NTA73297.1 hypothetical protein [Agrobacterium tumefaciens]NTJ11968.1 hypothetical protein [Rhizobium lusitanum]WCK74893.1 hypothetical protein G6L96_027940 [Agrobacterium tumefaciens]